MLPLSPDTAFIAPHARSSEIGVKRFEHGTLEVALRRAMPHIRVDRKGAWCFALAASGLLMVAYAVMCFCHPFGKTVTKDFFNFSGTLLALLAMMGFFGCARTRTDASGTWRIGCVLLGVGWALNGLGESVWLIVETWQRKELSSPSIADVWFIAAYLSFIMGLVALFLASRTQRRARIGLDSALVAGAFGALTWFFVLQPVWLGRNVESPIGTWAALFNPLFDVLLIWGALALAYTQVSRGSVYRASTFIAFSMVAFACADLGYAFLEVSGDYSSGGWNDFAIGAAYASAALCALAIMWDSDLWQNVTTETASLEEHDTNDELASLSRVLLPYFFTLCVFSLVGCQQLRNTGTLRLDMLVWSVMFLVMILARQMLSLSENARLSRQLRDLNTGLDQQVQARTRQLDALLQLTKAVNASLVESEVLAHAVSSASLAVPMDACAVWNWNEKDEQARLIVAEGTLTPAEIAPFADLHEVFSSEHLCQLAQQVARTARALDCCRDDLGFTLSKDGSGKIAAPCLHLEPLRFNGHTLAVLGALRVASSQKLICFSSDEARLLENVGLEVGTALENARIYAKAVDAADCDPATGLLNHRAMQGRFDTAWDHAQLQKTSLSVIMMDVNNFKNFNDLYGHLAGDEVLRLVAGVLMGACRGEDFVARYGGDEFFMLLPDTDASGALCVAQRLQQRMAQVEFHPLGTDDVLPLSLSFGVATAPDDAHSKLELIAAADKNLYTAKGSREAIRSTSSVRQKRMALLQEDGVAALDAMVTAVSNADAYTRQHSEDVTEYALWIAEELGLDEKMRHTIEVGGMLHDVGKICVPQDVLKKPGRLTDVEFAAMQTHPVLGTLLVGAVLPDAGVLQIVRSHHERFDGRGYPDALAGEDIPLLGRIVAVADAFSAMTTSRPYRKALSLAQARHEIERGIGTQFDPIIADAFISALNKRGVQYDLAATFTSAANSN